MTTVSWQLKLGVDGIDQVRKATEELNKAKKAAGETDAAVKAAAGPIRDAKGRFLPKGATGATGGIAATLGGGSSGLLGRALQGLRTQFEGVKQHWPFFKDIALGAKDVLVSAGEMAAAGVRAVVSAQSFKEDSFGALRTLLRSNELADQAFKTAVKTADFLGRGRQETVGQFVDLLAKGFDVKKVDEIVKSMADLATVDPKANMDAIVRAIGQIKGTGRLQGDELLQLADAGLETSAVYEQLAKILGKKIPDVQKLISAGKVDADTAITAILQAINAQAGGGKAGAAAAKKSVESISGLLRRLENLPENLLFSLDVAPGMERVRAFLKELVGFFDLNSDGAKELNAVLSDVFNEFIAGLLGEDPAANLKDSVKSLTAALKELNANGTTRQFGEMLGTALKLTMALVSLAGQVESLNGAISASTGVTGALLGDLGQFVSIPGLLLPGIDALSSLANIDPTGVAQSFGAFVNGLPDMVASLVAEASRLGSDIGAGIAAGITGAGQSVIDAITGVAGGAIQAAKNMLGIASPSKVFAELGHFTAEGFAVGVADNDNAQGALADMTAAPDAGGAPALRFGTSAGPINVEVNVTVQGNVLDGRQLGALVEPAVQRALESLAVQLGAVAPDAEAA